MESQLVEQFSAYKEEMEPGGYFDMVKIAVSSQPEALLFLRHPKLLEGVSVPQRKELYETLGRRFPQEYPAAYRKQAVSAPQSDAGLHKALEVLAEKWPTLHFVKALEEAHPEELAVVVAAVKQHLASGKEVSSPAMLEHLRKSPLLGSVTPEEKRAILTELYGNLVTVATTHSREEMQGDTLRKLTGIADYEAELRVLEPDAILRENIIKDALRHTSDPESAVRLRGYFAEKLGAGEAAQLLENAAHTEGGRRSIADVINHGGIADSVRFSLLGAFSDGALYDIARDGRDGLWPSSYRGVVKRLTDHLQKNHQQLPDILTPEQRLTLPKFLLQTAVSTQKPEEMLNYIPVAQQPALMKNMVEEVAKGFDLDESAHSHEKLRHAAGLAEWMIRLGEKDPALGATLEHELVQRAKNSTNPKETELLEKVAAVYMSGLKAQHPYDVQNSVPSSIVDADFFAQAYDKHKGGFQDTSEFAHDRLLDNKGVLRQLYIFPKDKGPQDHGDAAASFASFEGAHAGWNKESHADYVVYSKKVAGTPVVVYANRPGHLKEGQEAIHKEVLAAQEKVGAADKPFFSLIASRGHIYYFKDALPHIAASDTHLFFDGSCFGTDHVSALKEKNAKVQMIGTEGEGAKVLNEKFLSALTQEAAASAANKTDIHWKAFKDEHKSGDARAQDYVFPHENMALMLKEALSTPKAAAPAPAQGQTRSSAVTR